MSLMPMRTMPRPVLSFSLPSLWIVYLALRAVVCQVELPAIVEVFGATSPATVSYSCTMFRVTPFELNTASTMSCLPWV